MKLIEKLERFPLPISGMKVLFILLGILLLFSFIFFAEPFTGSQNSFTSGKYQVTVNVVSNKLQKGKNRLILMVNDKNDGLPIDAKIRGRVYDKEMESTAFVDIKVSGKRQSMRVLLIYQKRVNGY